MISPRLREIEETDARRTANGGVMTGEGEAPGFAIHKDDGNVTASGMPAVVTAPGPGGGLDVPRTIPAKAQPIEGGFL
jgi:hypothetical protein